MPFALTENVNLYFEETGSGVPILFLHEFAGDHRSWEPQVQHFVRSHRCITFAARGYPPSDVPDGKDHYSQSRAVEDAIAILDHLGIAKAHIVGISMGGFTSLHVGLRHPDRAISLVVSGVGYGSQPEKQDAFRRECEVIATALENESMSDFAARYALGPARVQFQNKSPSEWGKFAERLSTHSPVGSALTMRGVQKERPSLYNLQDELSGLAVPTLIINGDEDEGCLEAGLMLKRTIPTAGLLVLSQTGHTANLEEPDMFNDALADLFKKAESGEWRTRERSESRQELDRDGRLRPVRILVAKPGLDGHDRGAKTITLALRDAGFEVVYSGLHQSISTIVASAVEEDVDVVGISVLSGAHLAYTRELRSLMDQAGLVEVPIVVGGIIPPADIEMLREAGAVEVFPPNTNLLEIAPRIMSILRSRSEVTNA